MEESIDVFRKVKRYLTSDVLALAQNPEPAKASQKKPGQAKAISNSAWLLMACGPGSQS